MGELELLAGEMAPSISSDSPAAFPGRESRIRKDVLGNRKIFTK
jgi:hypothetical protein